MNLDNRLLRVQLKERIQNVFSHFEFFTLACFPLFCGVLAYLLYPNNPIYLGIGCLIGLVIGMTWMGIQDLMT